MQGITEKAALGAVSESIEKRSSATPGSWRTFAISAGILVLCFAQPLYELLRLSLKEEIYSHILLIPFISAYLVGQRRTMLPKPQSGAIALALGASLLPLGLLVVPYLSNQDLSGSFLAIRILAFWMFLAIITFTTLGGPFFRIVAFPLCFLLFAVPLPPLFVDRMETISKIASTEMYAWMMDLSQSTYFREGFVFALPGLKIEVAQECSGIRSSLVLFIVSVLAGNLFLTTTWRRVVFCLFVIPLGFIRNGFRIFTLSFLAVHWDRAVLDSPLHHRGGPIFFALSLIPFCLVLAWLRKSEYEKTVSPPASNVVP